MIFAAGGSAATELDRIFAAGACAATELVMIFAGARAATELVSSAVCKIAFLELFLIIFVSKKMVLVLF